MRKSALIFFACIALYGLFGFLIAPRILTAKLPEIVQNNLTGTLSMGAVKVNPFTLSVTIDRADLRSKTGDSLVSADRIFVNLQASSLVRRALYLKKLEIAGPKISAERGASGRLNLEELIPAEQAGNPETESTPLAFMVDEVLLSAGRLDFTELREDDRFETLFEQLQITLTDLATTPDHQGQFKLDMALEQGSNIKLTGQLGLSPLSLDLQVDLQKLPLPLVGRYLQERVPADLAGGTVSARFGVAVGGNPLQARLKQGSVDVAGLEINTLQGARTLISVSQLSLNGIDVAYPEGTAKVNSIASQGGLVASWLSSDGGFNWADLSPQEGPSTGGQDLAAAAIGGEDNASAWTVDINEVALTNYELSFTDHTLAEQPIQLGISSFAMNMGQFSSTAGSMATLQLQGNPNANGSFTLDGQLAPMEASLNAELALEGLDLKQLQPYLARSTGLVINKGYLGLAGRLSLGPNADPSSNDVGPQFVGSANISEFEVVDAEVEDVLSSWQRLSIESMTLNAEPFALKVDTVTWNEPYARVIINEDRSTNIQAAFTAPSATAAAQVASEHVDDSNPEAPPDSPETPPEISIGAIEIVSGSLFFSDRSLSPRFETGIEALQGSISDLSSESLARAEVDLSGSVDRYAPVAIKGQINPLSESAFTDLTLDFDGIELTSFSPYSGRFAGHSIRKGKLNLDLHYRLSANILEGENKIFLNQLTLGDRIDSPDATGLPVNLAIALLKDRNGNIDLDIPVRGDLDDPEFSLGGVIVKAFVGLITKVVTSPFGIFGKLLPGGGEDLQFVDFDPGVARLDDAGSEKLTNLAEGLFQRPQLSLEIAGKAHPDVDGPALARQQFAQANSLTSADIGSDAYWAAVKAAAGVTNPAATPDAGSSDAGDSAPQEPVDVNQLEAVVLADHQPSDDDLRSLANLRAQNIRAAVLEAQDITAESIFMLAPVVVAGGGEAQVRVELTLGAGD